MNRFAFDTAMSYLHTSSYKIETFKNQYNETSITASSPMQKKWPQALAATYRFRIDPVSSFVHPSLLLFSSFYRSRFQKRKQYGKNTETIRKPCGIDTETIGGTKKKQGRRKEERRVRTSYSEWFHSPVFRWRRSPLCSTLLPHHRAYLHGIYLFAQKSL